MNTRGRVRLVDVAARAGVTASTASRALARPDMVRPETRARVEAAAEELGYVPNAIARSLITGRSGMIVVLVPDLTANWFTLITRAIESNAQTRGSAIVVLDTMNKRSREAAVLKRVLTFADGIIIFMPLHDYGLERDRPPMVTVNRQVRGAHAVLIDQAAIAEQQVSHLVSLGHERMLFLDGPRGYWAAHERRRHMKRLAQTHDIEISEPVGTYFEDGVGIADRVPDGVTAVITFTDAQAVGLIARCGELGIRIPEDLSVIGANDVPMARMVSPPLTTVRAPVDAMGAAAVRLLLDRDDARDGSVIVETLKSELVVRRSTAPPRRSAP